MEEFVAKANIDHFLSLLATTTDSRERARIEALLSQERIKLAELKAGVRTSRAVQNPPIPSGSIVGGHGKPPGSDSPTGD